MSNESNDFLNSITKGNDSSINSLDSSSSMSNSDEGFLSGLKNITASTWLIIFLILSFFGFNIFYYLAKGTQDVTNFFTPIIEPILDFFAYATSTVVDVTAAGTQNIINSGTKLANEQLNEIQTHAENVQDKTSPTSLKSEPVQQQRQGEGQKQGQNQGQGQIQSKGEMQNNTLNNTLNTATANYYMNNINNTHYEADESTSKIQSGGNKSGWCYIGEDRGFRSCVQVGQQDSCMSGDIFPSQDICVNPSLRA
jgi:hypothetical protein